MLLADSRMHSAGSKMEKAISWSDTTISVENVAVTRPWRQRQKQQKSTHSQEKWMFLLVQLLNFTESFGNSEIRRGVPSLRTPPWLST